MPEMSGKQQRFQESQKVFKGAACVLGFSRVSICLSASPRLLVDINALSTRLPKEHGLWRGLNRDLNAGCITKLALDTGK